MKFSLVAINVTSSQQGHCQTDLTFPFNVPSGPKPWDDPCTVGYFKEEKWVRVCCSYCATYRDCGCITFKMYMPAKGLFVLVLLCAASLCVTAESEQPGHYRGAGF